MTNISYETVFAQLLYHETDLTVSHIFSFFGNTAVFGPEHGDTLLLRNISIYLHGVTVQKSNIVMFTAVRSSDLSCVLIGKKFLDELLTRNQFHATGFLRGYV
jgi:hypothetical protein